MNNLSKIIHLSPPNLAYFAPWRESIPLFEYFNSNGKFAQAAQILKDSSTEFTEIGILIFYFFLPLCPQSALRCSKGASVVNYP